MEKQKDSTLIICGNKTLRKIIIEQNYVEANNHGVFKNELVDYIERTKKYSKKEKNDGSPIMTRCA